MIRGAKAHPVLALLVSFSIICTLCLVLRICSARIQKRKLYVDDILVLVAYISMLTMVGVGIWGLNNGLGNPATDLSLDDLKVQAQVLVASSVAWVVSTAVVKIAVLWLYTRIFDMLLFVRIARIIMAICACYCVTFLVVFITHCDPASQQWNPVPWGSCREITQTELASNSINSLLDLAIVCLPLPFLWSLQMPLRKKITVIFLFSLGFVTVGIMFYRIYVTVHSNPDGIVALADVGVLSIVEVTYVGPAISRASESLFGSYGGSKKSKENSSSQRVNTIGGSGPAGGGNHKTDKGRWLRSSYTEISLGSTVYGERHSQDILLVTQPGAKMTVRTGGSSINPLHEIAGQRGIYVRQEFQTHSNMV
ncbi:hypothetical protein QBC37DRAFT_460014 [Rhypophila decipiens]|uniref:Rhodopsin domain-containing protein n=1 Tax=Rhypophila decipiens TaxID=261697 RepID=A0AAN6Y9A1_9PEZI|nr:hypothetical protein QBC37DRAFT_460014 [Rhypophila decipiens]